MAYVCEPRVRNTRADYAESAHVGHSHPNLRSAREPLRARPKKVELMNSGRRS